MSPTFLQLHPGARTCNMKIPEIYESRPELSISKRSGLIFECSSLTGRGGRSLVGTGSSESNASRFDLTGWSVAVLLSDGAEMSRRAPHRGTSLRVLPWLPLARRVGSALVRKRSALVPFHNTLLPDGAKYILTSPAIFFAAETNDLSKLPCLQEQKSKIHKLFNLLLYGVALDSDIAATHKRSNSGNDFIMADQHLNTD